MFSVFFGIMWFLEGFWKVLRSSLRFSNVCVCMFFFYIFGVFFVSEQEGKLVGLNVVLIGLFGGVLIFCA